MRIFQSRKYSSKIYLVHESTNNKYEIIRNDFVRQLWSFTTTDDTKLTFCLFLFSTLAFFILLKPENAITFLSSTKKHESKTKQSERCHKNSIFMKKWETSRKVKMKSQDEMEKMMMQCDLKIMKVLKDFEILGCWNAFLWFES